MTRACSHPPLAVSRTITSETRAPPRSPPSSRIRRSPTCGAPPPERSLLCQCPLTRLLSHRVHLAPLSYSLIYNNIGAKGATALTAILNETKLTNLKCAATPLPRPSHLPATLPVTRSQLTVQQPQRRGQTGRQRRRGQRRQHHLLASGRGAPRHRLAYPCTPDSPDSPDSPATPTTASPASPTGDSACASPTAPPPHSTACPPRSLEHILQHRGHLAHALTPRTAARRAALERACERPWLPRLAQQMRPHLGAGLWDEFVEHVNWHTTRRAGCARLRPHRACCAAWAALDGAPCMHAALVYI